MKKIILFILCASLCLSMIGCGLSLSTSDLDVKRPEPGDRLPDLNSDSESTSSTEPASAESGSAKPAATPAPAAAPYTEPELTPAGAVLFDGNQLASGSFTQDGVRYVKLSEAVEAIGAKLEHEDKSADFAFDWRLGRVSLKAGDANVNYLGSDMKMASPAIHCSAQNDLYVPVESFCEAAQIGYYYDEEFDTIYCTPASGSWELPEGYDVPVLMYHCIQWSTNPDANLMVDPPTFEKQLQYLNENGYTTIWFEDLWNIENIEKPVIITADDGYQDNFLFMLPLLEQYQCKATVFIICDKMGEAPALHMSAEQAKQLSESEYVSIQSHTMSHGNLDSMSYESQQMEMEESKRFITRLTGKEPMVLCYPSGNQNEDTLSMLNDYYRFGVKMFREYGSLNNTYNTSDDPGLVYRFFIEKQTPLSLYGEWVAHRNEGSENFSS